MDYYLVSYGLTFIALIIALIAQSFVSSTYNRYSKIRNKRGITGKEAARYVLDRNGLNDIKIYETRGNLTDHYDPTKKIIKLSSRIYNNSSIASVAIACHECGHAIQDKEGYTFMKIRASLFPFVNFSSYAGYIAILLGCIFGSINLIWIGILCEVIILLFQLVTLPVEIDASKRALKELDYSHMFSSEELKSGKIMLIAAASTYVASVVSSVLEILRLILLFGRRDD